MDINSFALGYSAGKKKGGSGGGAELNIHYSLDTPPEDTSKLWVKTSEPRKVIVSSEKVFEGDAQEESCGYFQYAMPISTLFPVSAEVDGKIYIFGGNQSYKRVFRFDPSNSSVKNLGDLLPFGISGMACATVGTNIFLFGGRSNPNSVNGYPSYGYVMKFDTTNETLTIISEEYKSGSNGISGASAASIGSMIYLFGGIPGSLDCLTWVSKFNADNEAFEVSNTYIPEKRFSTACAAVGKKAYIFGGTISNTLSNTGYDNVFCYNSEDDSCGYTEAKLPYGLHSMACAVFEEKVYLFGGKKSVSATNAVMLFDPVNNKVDVLPATLPTNMSGITASCIGNNIYIFGNGYSQIVQYSPAIGAMSLANGAMQIIPHATKNIFTFINSSAVRAEIGVERVYKGNEDNGGEPVEAALYKDGSWTKI
jgi:N-acetylneuraminic acid mutarotase